MYLIVSEVAHVCVCYMAVTSITNNCHVWSCLNLKKNFLSRSYSLSFYTHAKATISLTLYISCYSYSIHYTQPSLSSLTLYTFMLQLHYTLSPLSYSLSFSVHAKATILNHLSHSMYVFMLQLLYTLYSLFSLSMLMLKLLYSTISLLSHTLHFMLQLLYTLYLTSLSFYVHPLSHSIYTFMLQLLYTVIHYTQPNLSLYTNKRLSVCSWWPQPGDRGLNISHT